MVNLTTQSQLRDAVLDVVQGDPDKAAAMMQVIYRLVDPNGDPIRIGLGDGIMRDLYMLTPEFDESFRNYLAA